MIPAIWYYILDSHSQDVAEVRPPSNARTRALGGSDDPPSSWNLSVLPTSTGRPSIPGVPPGLLASLSPTASAERSVVDGVPTRSDIRLDGSRPFLLSKLVLDYDIAGPGAGFDRDHFAEAFLHSPHAPYLALIFLGTVSGVRRLSLIGVLRATILVCRAFCFNSSTPASLHSLFGQFFLCVLPRIPNRGSRAPLVDIGGRAVLYHLAYADFVLAQNAGENVRLHPARTAGVSCRHAILYFDKRDSLSDGLGEHAGSNRSIFVRYGTGPFVCPGTKTLARVASSVH